MNAEHPITPPPELLNQWLKIPEVVTPITKLEVVTVTTNRLQMLATEAARWGADQELEACCEWLNNTDVDDSQEAAKDLRIARRPKPPSLKELALEALEHILRHSSSELGANTIRRALEQLDD